MEWIFYNIIFLGALIGITIIITLELIIIGIVYFIKWIKNRKEK